MTTDSKNPTYEAESNVDMAKLREAVQKVFAYDPSAKRKDSVEPQTVEHRKRARKGSEPPALS